MDTSSKNSEKQPKVYNRDEHEISRQLIDPDALKIMYRLIRHGYKAFLVGGGVRDILLKKEPKDFDISTDATPRQIKGLFRNSRIIGRRFKLVHVFFKNNKIIEVSTFRDESEFESDENGDYQIRRDNTYGTEETDAVRRDLTINGLFYDLSSFSVIDYVGGIQDLRAGIIRIIGEPGVRIAEDPVRMLRAVRHAVRSDFVLDDSCRNAIIEHHNLIQESSQVRVFEEIKKDLRSGYALGILRLLNEVSLLEHLLPELLVENSALLEPQHDFSACLQQLDLLERAEKISSPTAVLALIALFSIGGAPSRSELETIFKTRIEAESAVRGAFSHFRVPRKERERIENLIGLWFSVIHSEPDRIKVSSLSKRIVVQEFYEFMQAYLVDDPRSDILQVIGAATIERGKRLKSKRKGKTGKRKSSPKRSHSAKSKRRNPSRSKANKSRKR